MRLKQVMDPFLGKADGSLRILATIKMDSHFGYIWNSIIVMRLCAVCWLLLLLPPCAGEVED